MNKQLKAVIPVAGLGTRMLPATKAIPKEMLPIVDEPLIQYIVNECVAAGINEIVLVSHSSKNAIENHLDTSFELESLRKAPVKPPLQHTAYATYPSDVIIIQVRQGYAKGLGHAILCAQPIIGDSPFIVLLPDVLLDDSTVGPTPNNLAKMINRFNQNGHSQVMVEPVLPKEVAKYGIADCGKDFKDQPDLLAPGKSTPMVAIVEKPTEAEAPSNLAVVGRYVLSAGIWPMLEKTPLGAGGEIQLTDAIAMLMEQQPVEAFRMLGESHDCGDKLGYMKAFASYGVRHNTEGKKFSAWLKETLSESIETASHFAK